MCTHGHEDHIEGLAGALNYATVGVAYCPVTTYDSKVFSNFVKYLDKQGVSITVPQAGDTFALGSSSVTEVGPIHSSSETNNTSRPNESTHGNLSLGGDCEMIGDKNVKILYYFRQIGDTIINRGKPRAYDAVLYKKERPILLARGRLYCYNHHRYETRR